MDTNNTLIFIIDARNSQMHCSNMSAQHILLYVQTHKHTNTLPLKHVTRLIVTTNTWLQAVVCMLLCCIFLLNCLSF